MSAPQVSFDAKSSTPLAAVDADDVPYPGVVIGAGDDALRVTVSLAPGVALLDAALELEACDERVNFSQLINLSSRTDDAAPDSTIAGWVAFDWGAPRTLTRLRVPSGAAGTYARLKLSTGGPWFPASPELTIALDGKLTALPALSGARLMLELGTLVGDEKKFTPTTAAMPSAQMSLRARVDPPDLTVRVDGGPPVFHRATPLEPRATLAAGPGLGAALRDAREAEARIRELEISASAPGLVERARLQLTYAPVLTTWLDGQESLTLDIPPARPPARAALARLDARPHALEFTLRSDPAGGHALGEAPDDLHCAHALRCGRGYAAAVRLADALRGQTLLGVDLLARARAAGAVGRVTLLSGVDGRPGAALERPAPHEFSLEPGAALRWLSAPLDEPLELPDAPVWLALELDEGELFWAAGPDGELAAPASAHTRRGSEGWTSIVLGAAPSEGEHPALAPIIRLRLADAREGAPPPSYALRWRERPETELPVTPGAGGRVRLDAAALSELPAPDPETMTLELVARDHAIGRVALTRPRLTLAPTVELFEHGAP